MKRKKKEKRRFRKTKIVLIALLTIILFLVVFNFLLREEIFLNQIQIGALKEIFPEKHVSSIRVYNGGLVSWGSTRVLCKSIYINNNVGKGRGIIEDPLSNESILLLVHESMHTYQGKTLLSCFKMSFLSLYNQFLAYIKYGSRSFAYFYPIGSASIFGKADNLNPEQEATIIEDYYYLNFMNGNVSQLMCYEYNETLCDACFYFHPDEKIRSTIRTKAIAILEKYR